MILHTKLLKVYGAKGDTRPHLDDIVKGGRVMIAFFVNYSTIAFPPHLPTLKRRQFFGAVAIRWEKNSYFPLPLDVRRVWRQPVKRWMLAKGE